MKRKIIILVLAFVLTFIMYSDKVYATCYKATNSNGKVSYTNVDPTGMADKVEKVDDSYCNEVFEGIDCAKKASSKSECQKCSGYVWDSSKSKCLTPNLVNSDDSQHNSNEDIKQNNYNPDDLVSCGGKMLEDIPSALPKVISIIYTLIQIAVPVVLVILGILDLFKGITAQKEEEIKKGQQMFVKRLISAALIFFVFMIVRLVISFAAGEEDNAKGILDCAECFISNKCE